MKTIYKALTQYLLLALVLLPQAVHSFVLAPHAWPAPAFTIEAQFTGDPDTPAITNWNAAFDVAAARWAPSFILTVNHPVGATDPCNDIIPADGFTMDGSSEVGFHPDHCGDAFGGSTLAVSGTIFTGGGVAIEIDIVFNSNKS